VNVPEIVAPKLEHADGAVIIRRNDTLWRISRRVYGHGVRYSTIYLANQDQISDPDRIWPGQVFKVPEKSRKVKPPTLRRWVTRRRRPRPRPNKAHSAHQGRLRHGSSSFIADER
jgi:LysM repeat protein